MKHEIEGIPEGFEVTDAHIISSLKGTNTDGSAQLFASITVQKIKPRRIVLEETGETRKPKAGEYIQNNGNYCLCRKPDRWGNEHEIWQVVEDNKCAE